MSPFDLRLPLIAEQARVRTTHVFHCWHAMKATGKQFHIAAFAQFAGLEERHVSAIITALADHDALPEGRAKVEHRASRLPECWTPPVDWIDWAIDLKHWRPEEAQEEAEMFACYWQAKSGPTATKLDWKKTWQNWCRQSRRPTGDYRPATTDMVSTRDHMARTAELYDRLGRTTEAQEIRRNLAASANVIPFNQPPLKMAQNKGG